MIETLSTGYDKYSPNFFKLGSDDETLQWSLRRKMAGNLPLLRKAYTGTIGQNIKDYQVRHIPDSYRRSRHDSAVLLILELSDGTKIGKRHNNNQVVCL